MELNFDKEIDAILRKARESESAFVVSDQRSAISDQQAPHLDADEISAFAENALPETAKHHYTTHLADCDLCRKKMSNLILLNGEAESENVHAEEIVPISSAIPWYRKLFAFPNLAYAMGALVLVFSGIIGFTILQNMNNSQISEVSKVIEKPNDTKEIPTENDAALPETSHGIAANTVSNTNAASNSSLNSTTSNRAAMNSNMSVPSATKPIASPIATPQDKTPREDDLAFAKDQKERSPESVIAGSVSEERREVKKEAERSKQPETIAETSDAVKAAPPQAKVTDLPVNGRNTTTLSAKRKQDSKSNSETTTVVGKTFKRQDNVWYDTAYNGQSTTNITRGTNEYKKLDKDLRVIVENLGGTIVVVWKEKAYRIR